MIRQVYAIGVVLALSSVARASVVTELEVVGINSNNTVATAQAIAGGSFTLPSPPNVFNPPGWATATVAGKGGGDVDFYSFSTTGGGVLFDIDNIPFSFDTIVTLFNASGTLVAYDDDSGGDPGTQSGLDSLLGIVNLAPGTYYAAVSEFSNFANAANVASRSQINGPGGFFGGWLVTGGAPVGDSSFASLGTSSALPYTLQISLQNPVVAAGVVPEPISVAVWSGLASLCGIVTFRRRQSK
jgi:hypothetical protein